MGKEIVISPVSRIEGHAKVTILLDDEGNVADTKVQVVELRGFEEFTKGRPVEEMPRITPRICGVCPWAHHLASAKAADAVFGVEIPDTAKKLRELVYSTYYVEDCILTFYFLAGPDFVMGPDADYTVRNVIGVIGKVPDIAKKVVRYRQMAQMMTQTMAGRAIHPDAAVPGGWSKPLTKEERTQLVKNAKELLKFATFTMEFAKENIIPPYLEVIKTLGAIETGFLGLVENGALNHYDGSLRMMQADGSYEDFAPAEYTDYIREHVEPWTYCKFPYYHKAGKLSLDPENPVGVFRVGSLARINVCDKISTPLAQKELDGFRKTFGRPAQQPLLYRYATLIELIYAAERTLELLNDPEITSTKTRLAVTPRAARGVGVVEAVRGTLIHDYETDKNGLLTNVNLIVATQNNNAAINMSAMKAAKDLIKNGEYDQGLLNTIEMAIRAYNPCFSCATHLLDGRIAVKLDIVNSAGIAIDSITNY